MEEGLAFLDDSALGTLPSVESTVCVGIFHVCPFARFVFDTEIDVKLINLYIHSSLQDNWLSMLLQLALRLFFNLLQVISHVLCLRKSHLILNAVLLLLKVDFELVKEALTQNAAVVSILFLYDRLSCR